MASAAAPAKFDVQGKPLWKLGAIDVASAATAAALVAPFVTVRLVPASRAASRAEPGPHCNAGHRQDYLLQHERAHAVLGGAAARCVILRLALVERVAADTEASAGVLDLLRPHIFLRRPEFLFIYTVYTGTYISGQPCVNSVRAPIENAFWLSTALVAKLQPTSSRQVATESTATPSCPSSLEPLSPTLL
jgi:hypothetical protein